MTQTPSSSGRRPGRPASRRAAEAFVRILITASGWAAIVVLAAIAAYLFVSSFRALREVGIIPMVTGDSWYPTSANAQFGFLPSEVGSLWVTFVALLLAVPFGVGTAVYLSEFAPRRVRETSKSAIELMAAIPSVVLGLVGLAVLVPLVKNTLGLDTGLTALAAGIMVGVMALPTIVSIAEDALHSVPGDLRRGSLALGNTRWQTTRKVVVPAAS
ncbi:MAG: ABC transporter permease subunit, partial [Coriobacteriia bacterium]|nr:ABC transporter permease subunit [Coriobacteriia bacterium]